MLYERMEKDAAEANEPESEARRSAMEEEEALLKVTSLPPCITVPSIFTFPDMKTAASQSGGGTAAVLDRG